MDFKKSIKLLKQEGFLKELTPKLLREYVQDIEGCDPSEIEEWQTKPTAYAVLGCYYADRFEEGICDGFIQHDYRFRKDTDDVVAELSKMIGDPPLYVQTSIVEQGQYGLVICVTRDDGVEEEIDCSDGFAQVVEFFDNALKDRQSDKRFYDVVIDQDSSYMCLTRKQWKALSPLRKAKTTKPSEDAAKILERILAKKPKTSAQYLDRAQELDAIKQFDLALVDYEHTHFNDFQYDNTRQRSGLHKDFMRKADLNFAMAKYLECAKTCSEVLADATDIDSMFMVGNALYLLRGRAYLEAGEFQMALDDFDKLIADNQWNADAHYYRAQTFTRCGDEAKAEQDRKKALELGYRPARS